jgi:hypothetical protein
VALGRAGLRQAPRQFHLHLSHRNMFIPSAFLNFRLIRCVQGGSMANNLAGLVYQTYCQSAKSMWQITNTADITTSEARTRLSLSKAKVLNTTECIWLRQLPQRLMPQVEPPEALGAQPILEEVVPNIETTLFGDFLSHFGHFISSSLSAMLRRSSNLSPQFVHSYS